MSCELCARNSQLYYVLCLRACRNGAAAPACPSAWRGQPAFGLPHGQACRPSPFASRAPARPCCPMQGLECQKLFNAAATGRFAGHLYLAAVLCTVSCAAACAPGPAVHAPGCRCRRWPCPGRCCLAWGRLNASSPRHPGPGSRRGRTFAETSSLASAGSSSPPIPARSQCAGCRSPVGGVRPLYKAPHCTGSRFAITTLNGHRQYAVYWVGQAVPVTQQLDNNNRLLLPVPNSKWHWRVKVGADAIGVCHNGCRCRRLVSQ